MTAASAGGFIVQLYGSDYDTDVSASGWSDDDGWHFYCLVYDGAEWSFYVDGAVAHTATASLATGSENPLTVGRRDGESYLTGSVDELYVYSSALSESEVQALYFQDTLVAYYSFDDGTAADDLGGLALDGIARAQLNGAVEGEFASEVKSTKLRMSSQKLSTLGEEATVLEAEDSSVSLGVALTGDATFAQFDVNQHAAEPGGSEATTKLVRFGLVQSSGGEDGRRRRRLFKVLDGRGRRLFLDGRGRRLFLDGRGRRLFLARVSRRPPAATRVS